MSYIVYFNRDCNENPNTDYKFQKEFDELRNAGYEIFNTDYESMFDDLTNLEHKIFAEIEEKIQSITILAIVEEETGEKCDQEFVKEIEKIVNDLLWDDYQHYLEYRHMTDAQYYGITDRVDPLK